jgi:colicin import membrane protein
MYDRKILFISLLISAFLHLLLIFIIPSITGKKEEKKIVWVSLESRTASGSFPSSSLPSAQAENKIQDKGNPKSQDIKSEQKLEPSENKVGDKDSARNEEPLRKTESPKTKSEESKNKSKELLKEKQNKFSDFQKLKNNSGVKTKKKSEKSLANQKEYEKSQIRVGQDKRQKERKSLASQSSKDYGSNNTAKNTKTEDKKGINAQANYEEIQKTIENLVKQYGAGGGRAGAGDGEEISGEDLAKVKSIYGELIRDIVQKNFKVPPSLQKEKLVCVVYIGLDESGNISDIRIEESSGNPSFDSFVMKAISDSAPFPAPPKKLSIYIRFSNRD